MTWWQFSLNCQACELELVERLLQKYGALSLSISDAGDEPIYEPLPGNTPVWRESIVSAIFGADTDPETLCRQISALLPDHLAGSLRRQRLQDRDWEQAYKQHFQPIECASGLWIVPSWSQPPDPEAIIIQLDPGLAFGTGSHPTTALCLGWLAVHKPAGIKVIDFGCGSGILAIAALKLGAARVSAVDIDAQALSACSANVQANTIETDRIQISSPAAMANDPVDLLIANILAGPLIELAPEFAGRVQSGGQILLSGILKSQLKDIQLAYQPYFRLDPATSHEDWVCISGKRI